MEGLSRQPITIDQEWVDRMQETVEVQVVAPKDLEELVGLLMTPDNLPTTLSTPRVQACITRSTHLEDLQIVVVAHQLVQMMLVRVEVIIIRDLHQQIEQGVASMVKIIVEVQGHLLDNHLHQVTKAPTRISMQIQTGKQEAQGRGKDPKDSRMPTHPSLCHLLLVVGIS